MAENAFQDYYPDHMARCYGCGRLNEEGYQIRSFWEGDESICRFLPKPFHVSIPGYVYGGLLASLIDCHGTGTAAAAAYRAAGRAMDTEPALRFLTASLHVDYLKPTPLGPTLEVHGRIKEVKGRKVVIEEWIVALEEITARGEVVAVQVPDEMVQRLLLGQTRGSERPASDKSALRIEKRKEGWLHHRALDLFGVLTAQPAAPTPTASVERTRKRVGTAHASPPPHFLCEKCLECFEAFSSVRGWARQRYVFEDFLKYCFIGWK